MTDPLIHPSGCNCATCNYIHCAPRPTGADNSRQSPPCSQTDQLYHELTGHWPVHRYYTLAITHHHTGSRYFFHYLAHLSRANTHSHYRTNPAYVCQLFRTVSQSPLSTQD